MGGKGSDLRKPRPIQIVKGWTKSGQSFERIFDVVWAGDRKPDVASGKVPAIGSTVDLANATYTNTIGSTELKNGVDGPGVRSESSCVLLCAGAGNSHAALDHHPGTSTGCANPRRRCPYRSGAGVEFADLVYAFGRGPKESRSPDYGGRLETKGGVALTNAQLNGLGRE